MSSCITSGGGTRIANQRPHPDLPRRKITGSAELTVQTGKLFLSLISSLKPSSTAAVRRSISMLARSRVERPHAVQQDMVKIVKAVGRRLIEAVPVGALVAKLAVHGLGSNLFPAELSIGNTVRRILHIIRTEYRKNLVRLSPA